MLATENCKICDSDTASFGSATILGKHSIQYFRCQQCGFIQTETPHWLEAAYKSAITSSDIGYVSRNISQASATETIIHLFFRPERRFVDFGGGYGMFVRLLRDRGFDYYRYDQFCPNLFAVGFDADAETTPAGLTISEKFELLTAFEVFEHLENPRPELVKMLSFSDNILFSTLLIPMSPPPLGTWWYYGPEHGQHLAFYTESALSQLAGRFGLHFATDHQSMHLLSKQKISPRLFRFFVRHRKFAWMINRLRQRKSLFPVDFAGVNGQQNALQRTGAIENQREGLE